MSVRRVISLERGLVPASEQANVCGRLLNDEHVSSDESLLFRHKDSNLAISDDIVFYQKIWSTSLTLADVSYSNSTSTIYLPLQGLYSERWYDGPIFRLSSNGEILSFLAQGFPARLNVPVESSLVPAAEQPIDLVEGLDLLNSATHIANQLSFECSELELVASIDDFSISTMVALVLMKKASPGRKLFAHHELDYKSWPSEMKRLCQNLGMNQYERVDISMESVFDLNLLISVIRPSSLELARAINHRSDVIPRNLI